MIGMWADHLDLLALDTLPRLLINEFVECFATGSTLEETIYHPPVSVLFRRADEAPLLSWAARMYSIHHVQADGC